MIKILPVMTGNMKEIELDIGAAFYMINGGKIDPIMCSIEIERWVVDKDGNPVRENGEIKTEIIKDYIISFKIGMMKEVNDLPSCFGNPTQCGTEQWEGCQFSEDCDKMSLENSKLAETL
jgi:hypothetical protein